jgi:site-specific DNA-cytosine methylase
MAGLFSSFGNSISAAAVLPSLAIKVVALCELHPEPLGFLRSRFGGPIGVVNGCLCRGGSPYQASLSLQSRGDGPAEIGTLFHDDVVTLVSVLLPKHALLAGSPPCQPWSTASRSGALGPKDDRAQSLQTIPWLLRKHGPAGGMFEQVEGLLAFQSRSRYDVTRPGPSYEDFASKCQRAGYVFYGDTHQLSKTGPAPLPQFRVRLLVFATRADIRYRPAHRPFQVASPFLR